MLDVVTLLLEKGADAHAKDSLGSTPLHEAVRSSQKEVAYFLLEHGADALIACEDDDGETPLKLALHAADAILEFHEDGEPDVELICKMLLQSGALVELRRSSRYVKEAQRERIGIGLEHAVESPRFLLDYGEAALHLAAAMGLNVVQLLVEKGANVNAKNIDGWTPLHTAAYCGRKAVAYFLLFRGAVAVISNNERLTPLDWAVKPEYGEPDVALICRMLLPSGALVQLATDVLESHEKRLKRRARIAKGLGRAVENAGFLEGLADTLACIDASGCAGGFGAMLAAVLRQLKAFANDDGDAVHAARVPKRRRLGGAYDERRRRYRLNIARAVQGREFVSGLAEGLAGVKKLESEPVAPEGLLAAAAQLDA